MDPPQPERSRSASSKEIPVQRKSLDRLVYTAYIIGQLPEGDPHAKAKDPDRQPPDSPRKNRRDDPKRYYKRTVSCRHPGGRTGPRRQLRHNPDTDPGGVPPAGGGRVHHRRTPERGDRSVPFAQGCRRLLRSEGPPRRVRGTHGGEEAHREGHREDGNGGPPDGSSRRQTGSSERPRAAQRN